MVFGEDGQITVVIITGATHTGKTRLAQLMMEKYYYPYISEDHLKMGLIPILSCSDMTRVKSELMRKIAAETKRG